MSFVSRVFLCSFGVLLLALGGCGDDGKRPIGANCDTDSQCEFGICGGGVCLDPEGDQDGDGLTNRIEAGLGTDPVKADSDGDGVLDPVELGDAGSPADADGDGKIDAIESATGDVDSDCIPDQRDGDDSTSNLPSEAFPEACGNGQVVGGGNDGGGNDGGDGEAFCQGTAQQLGGTCAAALGAMAGECFAPAGECATILMSDGLEHRFDNGARVITSEQDDSFTLYGPGGQTCGRSRETGSTVDDVFFSVTPEGGEPFVVTLYGSTNTTPSRTEVSCTDETRIDMQRASRDIACLTGQVILHCGYAGCSDGAECPSGSRCCSLTGFCISVEDGPSCPE